MKPGRLAAASIGAGLLLTGLTLPAAARADACQNLLPQSLADALARTYPAERIPLEYDNAPEDVAQRVAQGESACLGVASGELTGERVRDYVIALTARQGGSGRAVLALPRRGGWHLLPLQEWPAHTRVNHRVGVLPPGHYAAPRAAARPGGDERAELDCPAGAALVGEIGTAGTAYCWTQGRWLHVRLEP